MALPETLPFTLGWVTPTTATIAATPGTPTITAPGTVSPATATIVATPGTPTVTAPDTITPGGATITATAGAPTVSVTSGLPLGDLPWTLPFHLGGPNIISPTPATITAESGSPAVAGAPAQSPLPWRLPAILGGNQNLFPTPATITSATSTAVISGTGFPYQFPFTFPAAVVTIYPPSSAAITAQPGTPNVSGGAPAITPFVTPIFARMGTPTVTGPSQHTLTPAPATIATTPGTPSVHTVQSTTTVFICDGNQNFLDWRTGALIATPDNPIIATLAALIDSKTSTVQRITRPDHLPMLDGINVAANNLAVAISNCNTDFILIGYSLGAAVCSMALQQMQGGGLANYAPQCIGAVMFGNVCRQGGATAPVQTDPGGHGIWATNLITHTPTWWWEFVLPNDIATTIPNTPFGADVASMFTTLLDSYTGGGNLLLFILNHLGNGVRIDAQALGQLVLLFASLGGVIPPVSGQPGFAAHGAYHNTAPPGAAQTCTQLAANYINGLTANKPITLRTIIPQAATITAAAGIPFVSALVSPSGATITATGGVPAVTAPTMVAPTGATILAVAGTPDRLPGDLPWTLPVALGA